MCCQGLILDQFAKHCGGRNDRSEKCKPEERVLKSTEGHFRNRMLDVKHLLGPASPSSDNNDTHEKYGKGKKGIKGGKKQKNVSGRSTDKICKTKILMFLADRNFTLLQDSAVYV